MWKSGTTVRRKDGTVKFVPPLASPWQRGSNGNTKGLLRQYFPKSTDLSVHTAHDLARVESELNRGPRFILGDRAPEDLFRALLTSLE